MDNGESNPPINGNRAATAPSAGDLLAHGERLRDELGALSEELRGAMEDWRTLLRARLERQPYATLAAAAGLGYVLGGGVPPGVVRVLLGVSGRLAVERFFARVATPAAQGLASAASVSRDDR